jgi:predicted RNA-binding Zn-ribbon protein involved in translation (DUF1610 family)
MEHLDGNSIGGLLWDVFGREVTAATSVCDSCGSVAVVAQLVVYVRAPGTVVRCPRCGSVLMRIVRAPGRTSVDLRGLRMLELS